MLFWHACRKLGALPQLVHILASGEESGLAAAALWALLQLAADDPANQRVRAWPALPAARCITPPQKHHAGSPRHLTLSLPASREGNWRASHAGLVTRATSTRCIRMSCHALQAMATLGVVPHLVRLLESANEVIAEGASECLLHIVAPAEGHPAVHPSQLALRSAGAIPSLLSVVRLQLSTLELLSRDFYRKQLQGTSTLL